MIRLALTNVFGHITDKRTPSRPLGEVKLRRAGPVVRWVTTREAPVLKAPIFFPTQHCHIYIVFTMDDIIRVISLYEFNSFTHEFHCYAHDLIDLHYYF